MLKKHLIIVTAVLLGIFFIGQTFRCSGSKLQESYITDTIITNASGKGWPLQFTFLRGAAHNHPLMAIWITDTNYKYIETLYISESIGKGVFDHGDKSTGKWLPGPIRRPAALPVWAHSRHVIEKDSLFIPTQNTPMPDAITGATPLANFMLYTHTSSRLYAKFNVYFEINQTWDWNEYWTNNKYPEDEEYKTSCQPALVYMTTIDTKIAYHVQPLKLIGHSHYNGSNGIINPDLTTITTAKNITKQILVRITSD